mmetsp:Transcript_159160/g.510511  ORF Transcript_159160/g.510511 Transcript_159160/m.510511 type:complete len:201 (+) Transcript_159160:1902-2504(+)
MNSSMTIVAWLLLRASYKEISYRPLGVRSLSRNKDSTASGNSASEAIAATSQQFPIAPCSKSLALTLPSNKLQVPARSWRTGNQSASCLPTSAGTSPMDRIVGGKDLSTNKVASLGAPVPSPGRQTRSRFSTGQPTASGSGASSASAEKKAAALRAPLLGSCGPKCHLPAGPPKPLAWNIQVPPVVFRNAGCPSWAPFSS